MASEGNNDLCPMFPVGPRLLLSILSCFAACASFAQSNAASQHDSLPWVDRDTLIDRLVHAQIRQNRAAPGVEGYRVQVFSGSGNDARQRANELRRELLLTYPDMPIHLVYQPPNFKVRVGDCRSELEATRLKKMLSYHYPQGFVVRDVIQFPLLSLEQRSEDETIELEMISPEIED